MIEKYKEFSNKKQIPGSSGFDDECKCYLKELSKIYCVDMAQPELGSEDFVRFNNLVHLIEAKDSRPLFLIEWTNATAEIKSFTNYQEAVEFANCDHLLKISSFKLNNSIPNKQ